MINRKFIPAAGALALAAFVGVYAPSVMAGTDLMPPDSLYAPGTEHPAGAYVGAATSDQTADASGVVSRPANQGHGYTARQDRFLNPSISSPGASRDPAPGPGNH
jgi:hypothetical protein